MEKKPTYQIIEGNIVNNWLGRGLYTHTTSTNLTLNADFFFHLPEGVNNVHIEMYGQNNSVAATGWGPTTYQVLLFDTKSTLTVNVPAIADCENLVANGVATIDYISPENYNDAATLASAPNEHRFLDISGRDITVVNNPISGVNTKVLHSVVITNNSHKILHTDTVGLYYTYKRIIEDFTEINSMSSQWSFTSFVNDADVLARTHNINDTDVNGDSYGETNGVRLNSKFQFRLLDGMILEDVTNGSFYTVGEIGRYRGWHSHMKPTSQIGDYVHYDHGLSELDYSQMTDAMKEIYGTPIIRNANFGSVVATNGQSSPEIMYDLPSHFNYSESMYGY